MAAASPYYTELESARYCRCGVARLRSWDDRGYLTVRTDVDGRRFYMRDELDRVMQGLVEVDGTERSRVADSTPAPASGAADGRSRTSKRGPAVEGSGGAKGASSTKRSRSAGKAKKQKRPALPYTDPEPDTRRRGGPGGGR